MEWNAGILCEEERYQSKWKMSDTEEEFLRTHRRRFQVIEQNKTLREDALRFPCSFLAGYKKQTAQSCAL